jgi:hypothetical protein
MSSRNIRDPEWQRAQYVTVKKSSRTFRNTEREEEGHIRARNLRRLDNLEFAEADV